MKGVQCYELFGGIALKIHTFSFFIKMILQPLLAYLKLCNTQAFSELPDTVNFIADLFTQYYEYCDFKRT